MHSRHMANVSPSLPFSDFECIPSTLPWSLHTRACQSRSTACQILQQDPLSVFVFELGSFLNSQFLKSYVQWYIRGICVAVCLRELKQGLCINLKGWDGKGGSRGRGHTYIYSWFMLLFDRKQQNFVRQLSFNLKINKKVFTLGLV